MATNNKGIGEYIIDNENTVHDIPKTFCIYPEDNKRFDGQMLSIRMYDRDYVIMFRHILSPSGKIYYRVTLSRVDRSNDTREVEYDDNEYLLVTIGSYRMSVVKPILPIHQYEYLPWALGISRGYGHRTKYIQEKLLLKDPDLEKLEYLGFVVYKIEENKFIYDIDSCDNIHITRIIKILKHILQTKRFIIPGVTSMERVRFMLDYCIRHLNG